MIWCLSHRADPYARELADRHYNRQKVGAPGFVPPGRCLVLVDARPATAFWVTSYPFAQYVRHAWAGAWVCSAFRNEGAHLSSALIREAVACTRWKWEPPALGMVTFVNPTKVRRKRDFGRCYRRAGFELARCPKHYPSKEGWCNACRSTTEAGLIALQLLPGAMPEAVAPRGAPLPEPAFANVDLFA